MAGQEQQQPKSRDTEVDEDVPAAPPAPAEGQASAATQGVDDLLDEIDGVLESNAEEFVRALSKRAASRTARARRPTGCAGTGLRAGSR